MNKKFLCLTSIDGYRIRMRADSVLEYGDLYSEAAKHDGTDLIVGEKTIIGSYINTTHCEESTWVTETVEQIDEVFSELGYEFPYPGLRADAEAAAEKAVEDTTKHWSEQSLNEHDSLFERVWGRYKKSQPADPAKWVVPERGGKELGDCACCNKAVECGRATPDDPDEVKSE